MSNEGESKDQVVGFWCCGQEEQSRKARQRVGWWHVRLVQSC